MNVISSRELVRASAARSGVADDSDGSTKPYAPPPSFRGAERHTTNTYGKFSSGVLAFDDLENFAGQVGDARICCEGCDSPGDCEVAALPLPSLDRRAGVESLLKRTPRACGVGVRAVGRLRAGGASSGCVEFDCSAADRPPSAHRVLRLVRSGLSPGRRSRRSVSAQLALADIPCDPAHAESGILAVGQVVAVGGCDLRVDVAVFRPVPAHIRAIEALAATDRWES